MPCSPPNFQHRARHGTSPSVGGKGTTRSTFTTGCRHSVVAGHSFRLVNQSFVRNTTSCQDKPLWSVGGRTATSLVGRRATDARGSRGYCKESPFPFSQRAPWSFIMTQRAKSCFDSAKEGALYPRSHHEGFSAPVPFLATSAFASLVLPLSRKCDRGYNRSFGRGLVCAASCSGVEAIRSVHEHFYARPSGQR